MDQNGVMYPLGTSRSAGLAQRIRRLGTDGVMTTIAGGSGLGSSGDGGPATAATLTAPTGVALDNAGNLYFSDTYRIRGNYDGMRRFTPSLERALRALPAIKGRLRWRASARPRVSPRMRSAMFISPDFHEFPDSQNRFFGNHYYVRRQREFWFRGRGRTSSRRSVKPALRGVG